jgi:hypothetical protein
MGCRCEDDDQGDWEDGGDDEPDLPDDDSEPTISCPYCHKTIYEDAPQCPHCGEYVLEEDTAAGRKMWLTIIGAVLCLLAILAWFINS